MKSEMAVLWSRSSRMGVFLATFLSMGLSFSALAVGIDLNPASIVWNTNTWVDITVSNIPPSESVHLGLYVDINTNGSIDGPDVLLGQFTVQDGVTNALGSRVIPCDRDGQTNGVISAQISYYGVGNIAGLSHGVGAHLWKATAVGSGDTAVSQFSVTQPTSTVWITGQVIDSATTNPVAGALVELWPSFAHDGPLPKTWSTTNGSFHVFLPPEFNRRNLGDVDANKPGYFMQEEDEQGLGSSEVQFTNSLSLGENVLPRPLYVSSSISTQMCSLSGCVYDAATNPVAGILVSLEVESEDDDGGWSFAITDTNGAYALTMAKGAGPAAVYPAGPGVNRLGLVAVALDVGTITGDISGLDIYCPIATTLAKASVTDANSGAPIAGVMIGFGGEAMGNWGVTIDDGTYEIGLVAATNFEAGVDDEDELRGFGYVTANWYEGLDVPGAGIYTNAPFRLERGYLLSGNVYDEATNALASGWVEAREPGGEWVGGADVNNQGYYEMLLATGVYRIATWEYHELGYLNMAYSNYYTWDNWNYDPVTVTTAGVSGVDFYLPQGAYIRGVVMGNAEALPGADVSVHLVTLDENGDDHWEYQGSVRTGVDGTYEVAVPPGTNYTVRAAVYDDAAYWFNQLYDGVADYSDATPVSTAAGAPATNINFALVAGGIISGYVYEEDGTTPIENCHVYTETLTGEWMDGNDTDDSGHYRLLVPAGSYRVSASPQQNGLPYVGAYYDNVQSNDDAAEVVVTVSNNTSGIDFTLGVGGTISGHVYEEDGTTPIENCHVYTETFTGEWMDGNDTDVSGYYRLRVPAGSYRVSANPQQNGLAYVGEYYDNVQNNDAAAEVVVTVSNDTSGIDFLLGVGGTISGRVYADDGGGGVSDCRVYAEDYDSGEWANDVDSDSEGLFTLRLPAGQYRLRAQTDRTGTSLVGEWYSNTVNYNAASPVDVTDNTDTPDVDFGLALGFRVQGRVVDENGDPIPWRWLDAHTLDENENWLWVGGGSTDSDGYYSFALPTGDSYFVRVPWQEGSWYPDTYFDTQYNQTLATMLQTNAGDVIDNVNFQLTPGFKVWGHVYESDGETPNTIFNVQGYGDDAVAYAGVPVDENGAYALVFPTNRIIVLLAQGHGFEGEYFDNQYDPFEATFLQLPGYASTNADFVLYRWDEDHDNDGVFDYMEDTRPDGVFRPSEDLSSYTNADTDADGFSDGDEGVAGTNPKDPNSLLRLTGIRQNGSQTLLTWDSIPGRTYEVYTRDVLAGTKKWTYRSTLLAEGSTVVSTNTASVTNRFFRVMIQP